jgi:uncharacterized paraquat-inducible protein A
MKIADSMNESAPPHKRVVDGWIHTRCLDCEVEYALTQLDLRETADSGEYACPKCHAMIVEVERYPDGEIAQRATDGLWVVRPN